MLINRTSKDVEVAWRNTHCYLVTIKNRSGAEYSLNAHLPPPEPEQAPTTVEAHAQHIREFRLRPDKWPDLSFDPAESPYRITVELNSDSHRLTATAVLDVTPPPPTKAGEPPNHDRN